MMLASLEKGVPMMLVTTTDIVTGTQVQILGLVKGNVVTSKNIGRDMLAGFKGMAGGEIKTYTEMCGEARDIALGRMVAEAEAMGANAIMCMRFVETSIADNMTEMLAYGTAVKLM
jgi:uncharacterized protein YbjQ (UPF0145 family)